MPAEYLPPKQIKNPGVYGLILPASVDENIIPDGAVTEVKNFIFDTRGAAAVRPGLRGIGSTIESGVSVSIYGAFSGLNGTPLVVVRGSGTTTSIYNLATGALLLDGGTSNVNTHFVNFGSYVIAINFIANTYSSMRFWNAGSSRHWHFTGNPINPQNLWGLTPMIGEVYKNRMYVSEAYLTNSSRLYYSSVITSAGNITWTTTTDFIDINPGDGDFITALKRYNDELLVFKRDNMYRFKTTAVEADAFIRVGTYSQEGVVEGTRGVYFFDKNRGFYRYDGGYPVKISSAIEEFISKRENGSANFGLMESPNVLGWSDPDHIYWAYPDTVIFEEGLSKEYENIVLRYTESSDIWTILLYSNPAFIGVRYFTTQANDTNGIVFRANGVFFATPDKLNTATLAPGNDVGEPIEYMLRTRWEDYGSFSFNKLLEEINVLVLKALGARLYYQINDSESWILLGSLKNWSTKFRNLNIRFRRIRFKIAGESRNEPPVFRAIEMTKVLNIGLTLE